MQKKNTDQRISLDIGSTTLRISRGSRVLWQEASCLAIHVKTDAVIAIGNTAYNMLGKTGEQVTVIFPYQYGVVANRERLEQLLQAVCQKLKLTSDNFFFFKTLLGLQGSYAHLSTTSPVESQVLAQTLHRVGLGRLKPYDQMKAAARALGLAGYQEQTNCLVLIGGQITEVALVSAETVIAAQRIRWGGVHFTERIQELVVQQTGCAVSWHTAELIKRQLGVVSADGKFAKHKISVRGKNLLTQLGKTIVLSNEEVAPLCTSLVAELINSIQKLFASVPTEIVTSCLEQGVYIFGGGAQLAGLASYMSQELHAEVTVADEPDLVVIRGLAAVYS